MSIRNIEPLSKSFLLVTHTTCPKGGGIASVTRNLVRIFCDYIATHGGRLELLSLKDGLDEDLINVVKTRHNYFVKRSYSGSKIKLTLSVLRRFATRTYDYIIFDHIHWARVGYLGKLLFSSNYIIFVHFIEVLNLPPFAISTLRKARFLLANSYYTKDRISRLYNNLPEIIVTPLGREEMVGPCHVDTENEMFEVPSKPYFLIVGRMSSSEKYKGHDLLLEAMSIFKLDNLVVHLVVAGEGDDKQRLIALSKEKGIGEHVHFVGFVSNQYLARLYRHCIAFVMPSTGEGFGLVYIEAMDRRRPCIGCHGDAAEEIIIDNETGFLVESGNAKELSEKMALLLRNPHLAHRLGENGYRRFREHFSYEAFKQRITKGLGLGQV